MQLHAISALATSAGPPLDCGSTVTNWDEAGSAHKAANAARRLAHAIRLVRLDMDPAEVANNTGVDLHELLPHALPPGAWDAQRKNDRD